jgi:hypothetical protein
MLAALACMPWKASEQLQQKHCPALCAGCAHCHLQVCWPLRQLKETCLLRQRKQRLLAQAAPTSCWLPFGLFCVLLVQQVLELQTPPTASGRVLLVLVQMRGCASASAWVTGLRGLPLAPPSAAATRRADAGRRQSVVQLLLPDGGAQACSLADHPVAPQMRLQTGGAMLLHLPVMQAAENR